MTEQWPWPEAVLTYDNARLPQALILAGQDLGDPEMIEIGVKCLDWLAELQTGRDGVVSLVGHEGWSAAEHSRAIFDQQPVEASAMVEACATGLPRDARRPVVRPWPSTSTSGSSATTRWACPCATRAPEACADGLQAGGVNFNQGAESTLALLQFVPHHPRPVPPGGGVDDEYRARRGG